MDVFTATDRSLIIRHGVNFSKYADIEHDGEYQEKCKEIQGQEVLMCFVTDPYNELDLQMQRTREAINILQFMVSFPSFSQRQE